MLILKIIKLLHKATLNVATQNIFISFLFTAGVFLIGEIFYSLKRSELERARAENRILTAIIQTDIFKELWRHTMIRQIAQR